MPTEEDINKDLSPAEQVELLAVRMDELRPAVAEAKRIERRLASLVAWLEAPQGSDISGRRAFPTELRVLQVLELLQSEPQLRRADVARALNLTPGRAGQLVEMAIANGEAAEDAGRRLRLTESGTRRAQGIHPEQPQVTITAKYLAEDERDAGGEEGEKR